MQPTSGRPSVATNNPGGTLDPTRGSGPEKVTEAVTPITKDPPMRRTAHLATAMSQTPLGAGV